MPKTILITGAGSGIGKSAALALKERGHVILATTHHQKEADELTALGLTAFVLDVTKPSDRQKILSYDIGVLINNAGIGETGSLAEIDIDRIRHNFEVNVFGHLELTQLALKKMIANDRGTVIFISSLLGRVTKEFFGPYSMTKFAISCAAETLRAELARITPNVHACVVEPGAYHTGFNQKMIAKKFEWMDEKSYFFAKKDTLRKSEEKQFARIEVSSIDSIVAQIIAATEAQCPHLRYSAPWWQALGVSLLRMGGK